MNELLKNMSEQMQHELQKKNEEIVAYQVCAGLTGEGRKKNASKNLKSAIGDHTKAWKPRSNKSLAEALFFSSDGREGRGRIIAGIVDPIQNLVRNLRGPYKSCRSVINRSSCSSPSSSSSSSSFSRHIIPALVSNQKASRFHEKLNG